jgi:hypothetical protein
VKLFRRYGKIPLHSEQERRPVPIVADAGIAAATLGDGRLVPLLIINTAERPDLDELIRVHEHLPPGDVDIQWGTLPGSKKDHVALVLWFKKPIEATAILEFDIVRQGILIDQILTARMFYLQPGRPGDRLKTTLGARRIFVEVPDTGFRERWEKLFHKRLAKNMKSKGLGSQEARQAAAKAIEAMRTVGRLRMKR